MKFYQVDARYLLLHFNHNESLKPLGISNKIIFFWLMIINLAGIFFICFQVKLDRKHIDATTTNIRGDL